MVAAYIDLNLWSNVRVPRATHCWKWTEMDLIRPCSHTLGGHEDLHHFCRYQLQLAFRAIDNFITRSDSQEEVMHDIQPIKSVYRSSISLP